MNFYSLARRMLRNTEWDLMEGYTDQELMTIALACVTSGYDVTYSELSVGEREYAAKYGDFSLETYDRLFLTHSKV